MNTITLSTPDTEQMQTQVIPFARDANGLAVVNQQSHAAGLSLIARIASVEREVVDLFAEPKRAAHAAHKAITEAEKKLLTPLQSARSLISGKCDTYEREQRRLAQAEQARLEREAREREEQKRLEDSVLAQEAGEADEAQAILESPVIVPAVHVAPAVAEVEGVGTQTRWSAEVTNLHELIVFVAAHPEWVSLLEPSMPSLNRLAVTQRQNMNIPGVRAVPKTIRTVSR